MAMINQYPFTYTTEEEVRPPAPSPVAFLADARAWRMTGNLRGNGWQAAQSIGLQCRYALELTSFNGQVAERKVSVAAAAAALLALVPHLPVPRQEEALEQVLTMAQSIGVHEVNQDRCSDEVASLAMLFAKRGQVQEAFALARTISPEEAHEAGVFDNVITSLMPTLSDEERNSLLQQTWALLRAQPNRDLGGQARLITASRRVPTSYASTQVALLTALMPYLSASQQKWLMEETYTALRAVPYDEYRVAGEEALSSHRVILGYAKSRAEVLAALLPHLPAGQEQYLAMIEGFAYIRAIPYIGSRVEALGALFAYLPEIEQRITLDEVLYTIESQHVEQANLLSSLAPHLSPAQLDMTLTVVQAIPDNEQRALALLALAPHLPEQSTPLLKEALSAVQAIANRTQQGTTLAALVPYLPSSLQQDALMIARLIPWESASAKTLATLAPLLSQLPQDELYPRWQKRLRTLAQGNRSDLLAYLRCSAPIIVVLGEQEAVSETVETIQALV